MYCRKVCNGGIKEMGENIWEDLIEKYNSLIYMISDYNKKIESGQFLEYSNILDVKFVNNVASVHIINLLMENDNFYVPNKDILLLILQLLMMWGGKNLLLEHY